MDPEKVAVFSIFLTAGLAVVCPSWSAPASTSLDSYCFFIGRGTSNFSHVNRACRGNSSRADGAPVFIEDVEALSLLIASSDCPSCAYWVNHIIEEEQSSSSTISPYSFKTAIIFNGTLSEYSFEQSQLRYICGIQSVDSLSVTDHDSATYMGSIVQDVVTAQNFGIPERCDTGWTYYPYTGYCYVVLKKYFTFKDARNSCLSIDGDLVSIHSKHENDFVNELAAIGDTQPEEYWHVWIGLTKGNGTVFEWTDGSVVDYTNFANSSQSIGENRLCCQTYPDGVYNKPFENLDRKWHEYYCFYDSRAAICKMAARSRL